MTDGTDSAAPMWSIPGYGFSVPVMDATGQGVTWADQTGGLTKRELFAAMAMQGLLANPGGPIQANQMCGWSIVNCEPINVGQTALGMADALIAALNEATP